MRDFLRILYPARCPVCDGAIAGLTADVCPACAGRFRALTGARCRRCSKPLYEEGAVYCEDCAQTKHAFDKGFALYAYRDVASSLYRFKYLGRQEYAAFYARELTERFGTAILSLQPDALLPVPLHKSRLQKRGFNQAQVLSEHLGRALSLPVRPDLVERVKRTVPQKECDRTGRRNNLKNAFKLTENDVKLKTIVMVDDIYTTGATMDAVARILRASGVSRLYFVTIAIGA